MMLLSLLATMVGCGAPFFLSNNGGVRGVEKG